jgi:hypothetical protein
MDPAKDSRTNQAQIMAAAKIAFCTAVVALLIIDTCRRTPETRIRVVLTETPEAKQTSQSRSKPDLPYCPDGDSKKLRIRTPKSGDHAVVLVWQASTSALSDKTQVGYCLYRRKGKPIDTRTVVPKPEAKIVPCKNCEQVNRVPIVDVGCVDEIVPNRTKYYYAAATIDARGDVSTLSPQAFADIPGPNVPRKSRPVSAYRSCREWDGAVTDSAFPKSSDH